MNRSTTSASQAWRNVLIVIALSCLIIGLPNFVVLPRYFNDTNLRSGAGWFLVSYAVCVGIVVGLVLIWLRRAGSSLTELGWAKPTTLSSVILGVVFGLAWLALSLFGASFALKSEANFAELSLFRLAAALLGVLISVGEEIIVRGFVMNELNRASVPTWLQIIVSGLGFALYHSLGNFGLASFTASFVVSAAWAVIYVLGKRSLTPSSVSHGIVNFFGEPFLAMMILSVFWR